MCTTTPGSSTSTKTVSNAAASTVCCLLRMLIFFATHFSERVREYHFASFHNHKIMKLMRGPHVAC